MTKEIVDKGKTAAIVGYFSIVGSLIAITMNMEPKNPSARFHIRQAFGLHLCYHALAIGFSFSGIPYISLILFLGYVILWGFGFFKAIQGKVGLLPLIGAYFQKWFTFIQ